jgi:microcystin-dependent protein
MYKQVRRMLVALGVLLGSFQPAGVWAGGTDPFVGEILWVPYNFAPRGWAECNGQLIPIAQNTALFSLLGTTYGGDGRTTFGLPDMRGRLLIHAGQGPGLSQYSQGQSGGQETVTLLPSEIPAHTHSFNVSTAVADQTDPTGKVFATAANGALYATGPTTTMSPAALSTVGGSQPHNNMMPYLTLTCIIALQGIFPPRP